MTLATNNFSSSAQVGQGGYGKVYKGILADGTVVAIKRAQEGSLQGSKEFFTEIELLSRLHHRNLVSLLGYCDEENEQVISSILLMYSVDKITLFIPDYASQNGPTGFDVILVEDLQFVIIEGSVFCD